MRTTLLEQIRKRRKELGLKGIDMPARTGINRQQYGLIEKAGNPNLETLDKIAEGLEAELMLIPKECLAQVKDVLQGIPNASFRTSTISPHSSQISSKVGSPTVRHAGLQDTGGEDVDDPWKIIEQAKGDN
ncbi:DNA-binding XRE family transcriptional regulator [Pseudomonas nitritireducens]|uniref:DNA-binding XRE family transcriptional regulator n=1 Tax=Pseudomonas nitroreducens TaxID=46680 RepID=A0A7W7KSJ3_PSENT|nr:helix-turn-helix transcriptional regulator [Pseudomonas nitritireducens]MBB4868154.1 DNA-binding XRE family transcriptional regulator [Pseudomonas nitritireducens]